MDILKKAREWFKTKPPAREIEEDEEDDTWIPPNDETVRYRLMILWANYARSGAEESGDASGADSAMDISRWVREQLAEYATGAELTAHALPFGSWSERQIIDYSWSQQGGVIVAWALGLEPELPGWDIGIPFGEVVWELETLPVPTTWRPNQRLRPPAQIEAKAVLYETCYWRLRCQPNEYVYKLMGRASRLGTIVLAPDGDLATADGRSASELDADEYSMATSLLSERLRACNWLLGQDEDWDYVTADTIVGWLWDANWKEPEPGPHA